MRTLLTSGHLVRRVYRKNSSENRTEDQILSWMEMPVIGRKFADEALQGLQFLNRLYIYKNIQVFDSKSNRFKHSLHQTVYSTELFDNPRMTDHCFSVRNRSYQQIFMVGTAGNRKPGTILPFTLRAVDQYNRLAIVIRKYFNFCFKRQV